jgi:uncharacterized protein YgiB involved in biofilm formation
VSKRTKDIKHNKFRKVHHLFRVTPIALGVCSVLMLSGCGPEQIDARVYKNVGQCITQNPNLVDACRTSYKNAKIEAQKTAPKYATREDCEEEFGTNSCKRSPHHSSAITSRSGYSRSSNTWTPSMSGYLMGRSNGYGFSHMPMFTSTTQSSPAYGKFVDATGRSYGKSIFNQNMKVDRSVFVPKPETTSTIKRGGFGESVKRMNSDSSGSGKSSSTTNSSHRSSYRSSYRSYGG